MLIVALLFAVVLAAAYLLGYLPLPLLIAYGAMSACTFLLYGLDKHAAIHGRRRTPERHLHLLSLLGGWPGALLAQPLFRHKWRKTSFQIVFWLGIVINLAALTLWLAVR